ncbi:MAG: hypothetical protein WCG07_01310 [Candidatus Taylorbacteria bacterium]
MANMLNLRKEPQPTVVVVTKPRSFVLESLKMIIVITVVTATVWGISKADTLFPSPVKTIGVYGIVTDISSSTLLLDSHTKTGTTTYDIDITIVKKIETQKYVPLTIDNIHVGDMIVVQGEGSQGDTLFAASRIVSFTSTSSIILNTATTTATSTEASSTATTTDSNASTTDSLSLTATTLPDVTATTTATSTAITTDSIATTTEVTSTATTTDSTILTASTTSTNSVSSTTSTTQDTSVTPAPAEPVAPVIPDTASSAPTDSSTTSQ